MKKTMLPIALALGSLAATGPLGTDMYLGALPEMANKLGATSAHLQMTVMSFFAGFTLGQLFYGPISDRVGRKPVIYVALAIYIVASIGCMFAASADQLIAFRFVQGLGGSIGMVIGAAVIRDLYTGHEAAKLMSIVVLVMGVAPILAPLAGSLILKAADWRVIFAVLAGFALYCAILVSMALPETRMAELRRAAKPAQALGWYGRLLVSRSFIPYAGTLALVQGGFFAYIAGSSFVFIDLYGLSPIAFSVIFAVNSIGLGIGSQISIRMLRRLGARRVVQGSTAVFAIAALALAASHVAGLHDLVLVSALFFLLIAALGGIMPSCNTMAMEAHGAIAGTAAALMGALGFGAGALGSFMVGALADGTALPLYATIAVFAMLGLVVSWTSFGEPHTVPAHAAH